jgi:hypothetical protein
VKQRSAIIAIMILSGAAPALAETPEGRQACMNDAFRVCQDAIPDRERVFKCLAAHKDAISPTCRSEVAPAQPAERTSLPPAQLQTRVKSARRGELSAHHAQREAIAEKKAGTKKTGAHAAKPAGKPKTKLKIKSTARSAPPQRSGQPLNLAPR